MIDMVKRVAKAQSEEAGKWRLLEHGGKWYAFHDRIKYDGKATGTVYDSDRQLDFGRVTMREAQKEFDAIVQEASVRAGIQAMREPTNDMTNAGSRLGVLTASRAYEVWIDMIDRALR